MSTEFTDSAAPIFLTLYIKNGLCGHGDDFRRNGWSVGGLGHGLRPHPAGAQQVSGLGYPIEKVSILVDRQD
nr:putative myristylated membrane protein [Micropterus salmoides ranavirus]WHA35608.1 putative myristylated membrane protein [Siniperca chuatsi ranavirus]